MKRNNRDLCFVDFTYKREFDTNQRSNLLSAFEVIDSLKESIKNADKSEDEFRMLKSPLDIKILDDSSERNFNNKENVIYYNSTENLTQTFDNQILQTEKNTIADNDISKNMQTVRMNNINGNNKNPKKLLLQNLTIESDRMCFYFFIKIILENS